VRSYKNKILGLVVMEAGEGSMPGVKKVLVFLDGIRFLMVSLKGIYHSLLFMVEEK
jgi:hypothetical protein